MENIGDVKIAKFHPDTQRKRIYFATAANFIGALDSRSGEILWRHSLGATESVDAIAHEGVKLASVSGGGRYLRVWSAAEGYLLWDLPTGAAGALADVRFVGDADDDEHEDIAVAAGNTVALFSGKKGKLLWRWQADPQVSLQLASIVHASVKGDSLKVVGRQQLASGSTVEAAVHLSLKSGSSSKGAAPLGCSCVGGVVALEQALVCLESARSLLCTWDLSDLSRAPQKHTLDSLAAGVSVDSAAARLDVSAGRDVVLAHLSANACVALRVSPQGGVSVEHAFHSNSAGAFAVGVGADKRGEEHVAQVSPAVGGGLELTLLTLKSKTTRKERLAAASWSAAEDGSLAALWVQPYVRKEGSVGVRTLLKSTSLKLSMLQQDTVLWTRNEALAYVSQAVLVDIPVPPPSHNELMHDAHMQNPLERLVKRTLADAADLLDFITTPPKVLSSERKQADWDTVGVSLKHDLLPDRFGFKKVIVVITSPGVVAGIHSDTAQVVWQRYYENTQLERVFLTRGTATDGNLECVVIAHSTAGEGLEGRSMAIYLQPLTGVEFRALQVLKVKLEHAAMLPLKTKSDAQIVLGIDEAKAVHVFPDTDETRSIVAAKSGTLFYYMTHPNSSAMTGHALVARPAGAGGRRASELYAVEAWAVALPSSETITALAPHMMQEAIRSAGRVLGNRAVLLKYINSNSLAVASESLVGQADNEAVSSAPTLGAKEPCVRVYLIDTVSGAIIHSVVHRDAKGPVRLVQTENTVVYTFFNNKKHRHEISVMELYENSKHEIITAGQMMMYNDSKTSYSSHGMQPDKPRVLSQTYILPLAVKTLSVTQSVHGITTRNILVALANDQVLSLDRKFLDPRRPIGKPTENDIEEMLVPYSPYLPIIPTSVLSYNRTVQQLRGFAVAPARIESTSLMLAYGVDLFFSRVSPAKAFDCLGEDFNYASLILAVAGLALLSAVANWYANKCDLDKNWK